jgi:hypothetical protein
MEACRHGGMTELGDADMTEQNVMALSGHRTPEAARLRRLFRAILTRRATSSRESQ